MEHTYSILSETVRFVHKFDGFSNAGLNKVCKKHHVKSIWIVGGYEWEVQFYPSHGGHLALKLVFLGEVGVRCVKADLTCHLVDPSGTLQPSSEEYVCKSTSFQRHSDSSRLYNFKFRPDLYNSAGYVKNDSLTMECAITVFKDLNMITAPSSNLSRHLGELLDSQDGADVIFDVSGESFAAHKSILAARSPVFKAEFFGKMKEESCRRVEIKEMEPLVFGYMLRFIYTDVLDELGEGTEMAKHLLVAADRYGLDGLKVMCEDRLAFEICISNAAATLALAEQFGCPHLKAKCIKFIAEGSSEILHAVLETKGFKDLEVSTPSMVTELLKAAHGRMN